MSARRIAVVTGSRAEFGLLRDLLERLHGDERCELSLLVTGSHLAASFGATVEEIRAVGLPIAAEIPCLEDGDAAQAVVAASARVLEGVGAWLAAHPVDLVLLLGDRFEAFAAASAAFLHRIPIAHLHGGEVTAGALDDGLRHAISKLASWHFPAAEPYAARLQAMGEPEDRIHRCGALAFDGLSEIEPRAGEAVVAELGLELRRPLAVATFHPVTAHPGASLAEVQALIAAIEASAIATLVVTAPNADHEHVAIARAWHELVARHPNARLVASLGRRRYLATLATADLVLGNSSSGLFEAGGIGVPVVNVGERQAGRLAPANVVDTVADTAAIARAIEQALAGGRRAASTAAFGDGASARRMVEILVTEPLPAPDKAFVDGPAYAAALAASGLRECARGGPVATSERNSPCPR